MQEIARNEELPEATSRTIPDETTNNINIDGRCLQTQNEIDNRSVETERMDVLPAPEQKNMSNANDSKDTLHALPTAPPTDDSYKTI